MLRFTPSSFIARAVAFTFVLLAHTGFAQSTSETSEASVIHTGSTLVIVDVTVQDKNGHPVQGLRREDFTLAESKQTQAVRYFEPHSSAQSPVTGPELPPMPSGTFTDYTPAPASGSLNILLLDMLNTPTADQSYVRNQLRQFAEKVKPGTRVAVFGLSRRLFLLQGFSSDPQILKNAAENKLTPRPSDLLEDAFGAGRAPDNPSDIASAMSSNVSLAATTSSMRQFEAEQRAAETKMRVQYTLDAFNMLAHYLSAFQGRKNLMWFSGSFPLSILPDPSGGNGLAVMEDNGPEYRETIDLLSRAQVAVYPLDARGLMTDPTFSAAIGRKGVPSGANPPGKTSSEFYQSQADEHMTMSQLAEDTGGVAFYNTNDLAGAVEKAIQDGSNYYTLTYSPADRNWNGAYREIRVALKGDLQRAGYRLTYRHGYYADDPNLPPQGLPAASASASLPSPGNTDTYARAAMSHGAPLPQDILFKVRILPAGNASQPALAVANVSSAAHPIKPPYKLFAVDFAVVGNDIQLAPSNDGKRTGAIEFNVFLYDNDGELLNATGNTVQLNLTPDGYKRFLKGVTAHFEISVPVQGGGSDFLRVGVHDISTNHFGVVEVPVSAVTRLQPLPTSVATPVPKEDVHGRN